MSSKDLLQCQKEILKELARRDGPRCRDDHQEEQGAAAESPGKRPEKPIGLRCMAVISICGWEPLKDWHRPPQLGVAWVKVSGRRVLLGLCGVGELCAHPDPWPIKDLLMVSVLCGDGRWARNLDYPHYYDTKADLSLWSRFQNSRGDGSKLPNLEWPWKEKIRSYRDLTQEFTRLWNQSLIDADRTNPRVHQICLVFFCKAGRHRSFALMIAFLMWASHVHSPQLWFHLIAPIRDTHMNSDDRRCELVHKDGMSRRDRKEGNVPFASVLEDYAEFLNSEFPSHRWLYSTP